MRTAIQDATDRLRALVTLQPLSSQIYMTGSELFRADVTIILDELHRLHEAVHKQRAQLERRKMTKKSLGKEITRLAGKKHASGQPRTHEVKRPQPTAPGKNR